MNNLTNDDDARVKDLFVAEGYFHIDLFDGMRLSGPIRNNAGQGQRTSRLVETGPSNDWDGGMSLDHLVAQRPT
jgi:hypothetical protein